MTLFYQYYQYICYNRLMKKPNLHIKRISIRITLYFTSLLLMIAVVITALNVSIYSKELSEQMDNVVTQKLSLITGRLNDNIQNLRHVPSILINNRDVINAFESVVESPTDTHIKILSGLLGQQQKNNPEAKHIIALGMNGEIYDPISAFPAYKNLTVGNKDFEIIAQEKQYHRFSIPNTFPLEYKEPTLDQRSNITLYAQFYNYETITQLGYLAINFNKNQLFADIKDLVEDSFTALYIIDDQGQLVHQIGTIPYDHLPTNLVDSEAITIEGKDYALRSVSLQSYERWHLVSLFDTDIIKIRTNRLNRYIYITLLIALLLMVLFSFFISKKITNPILEMIRSMDEFKRGQWPEPLTTENEDEIKDLIEGYNTMLTSTIKLTDDIIGRQIETQAVELDLIKTQLHLLEAQINPHFIHNTLNSMNYLALSKGNHELSATIEAFNKLLRMSMAIDVSFINVAQELDNIKAYAKIQNVRFENAFEIDYVIDPEAKFSRIPKLILQPIVENAIIHGILPKGSHGHIIIAIRKKANMLMITVTDDGVGMTSTQLTEILNTEKKGAVSKHIGVQNVFDRLRLYYGDGIHLSMKSQPTIGTTTIIMIPYED